MIGDDFHVTTWIFAEFPINLDELSAETSGRLLGLAKDLNMLMEKNVSYKQNAGKLVGNYNLARCREVTDVSDRIFADYLGLSGAWEDIELLYAQVVKTDFSLDAVE